MEIAVQSRPEPATAPATPPDMSERVKAVRVTLRNGRDTWIRPVERTDGDRLGAFLRGLSLTSRRWRFFSAAVDLDRVARWAAG
jgi:hypothetical protein